MVTSTVLCVLGSNAVRMVGPMSLTSCSYVYDNLREAEWFGDLNTVLISPALKWANLAQMLLGLLDSLQVCVGGSDGGCGGTALVRVAWVLPMRMGVLSSKAGGHWDV